MNAPQSRPALDRALVSVVLPVFNEGAVLKELYRRVRQSLAAAGVRPEIIFVNDGSTDSSPRVLDKLAAKAPEVRVLHFSRNFGHQAAVQAGLAEARGDAVVLMDSDMQDEPETILRFLAQWQAGYDVVYAIRAVRQEPRWKRFLFSVFHRLMSSVASVPIPADAGNFSLIDRRLVREIVAFGERDRYLPGLRSWIGYAQIGVPVRRNVRYDNKPRVSLRGLWRLAKTAIFSFSTAPLTVFYAIGYASLGLFAVLSAGSLFCKLFTSWTTPGWTSQMLVASFFGAVNALGVSMLGEYVVRIYDQVRGRPPYIIARRAGRAVWQTDNDAAADCEPAPAADENAADPRVGREWEGPELAIACEAAALTKLAAAESSGRRVRGADRSAGRASADDAPQVRQGRKSANRRKR